jgi:hypothetical protein
MGVFLFIIAMSASFLGARLLQTRSWAQFFCAFWLVCGLLILGCSFVLSAFSLLASTPAWIGVYAVFLGGLFLLHRRLALPRGESVKLELADWWGQNETSPVLKWLVQGMWIWIALLLLIQTITIFRLAPSLWDSMSYIMPRTLLFLQHGSLERYFTLDLNQQAHVTGMAQFQIFCLLVFHGAEAGFALPSLVAFAVAIVAVGETGRLLVGSRSGGTLAAFVFATAVNCLLMATTAQSDLPIAALFSVAVCFAAQATLRPQFSPVLVATFASSIALTVKASALLALVSLLPLLLLGFARWWQSAGWNLYATARVCVLVACVLIIVLPSGFVRLALLDGHPLGSSDWRAAHELTDVSFQERLGEGGKNALRYLVLFTSLDGFYGGEVGTPGNAVRQFQKSFRSGIESSLQRMGVDLTDSTHSRVPFSFHDEWELQPMLAEDFAYPGVVFLAAVFLAMFCLPNGRWALWFSAGLLLSACAYLLLQSFAAQWDPWRGRSFSNIVAVLAPLTAGILMFSVRRRIACVAALVLAGGWQSASAIVFRQSTPMWQGAGSQSTLLRPGDRVLQLSRFLDQIAPPEAQLLRSVIREYNWLVPEPSHLGLFVAGNSLVYPFFDRALSVHYVNSVNDGKEQGLDAVIFHESMNDPEPDYLDLGWGYRIWRASDVIPPRPLEEMPDFFRNTAMEGIGAMEGPYGESHPRPFCLVLQSRSTLEFVPISDQSELVLEMSALLDGVEVEIFVQGVSSYRGGLEPAPDQTIIRIPVDAPRKQPLQVEVQIPQGIKDVENEREIFAYLFKAKLIPVSR